MQATYVSSSSFTVSGNETANFTAGRRIKADCGGDGIKYATITSSSYSSPNTTVNIDESTLTSNLTDVWYGVVQPGATGSLPDHSHDGSEGSGGSITVSGSGATTLLELTDTPAAYDTGKYLRSTVSGTEWATVSGGSGTDDHSLLINLDYASSGHTGFQASGDYATSSELTTTSGDIVSQIITDHSNLNSLDYASSGHTGFQAAGDYATSSELTTTSGDLQTQIDNKPDTLLELTDTPAAYDNGKYLRSTAAGTEWATVSGGSGTDDHSLLTNLDYASSGHTGFAASGDLVTTFSGLSDTPADYPATSSGSLAQFVTNDTSGVQFQEFFYYGTTDPTISGVPAGSIYYKYTT